MKRSTLLLLVLFASGCATTEVRSRHLLVTGGGTCSELALEMGVPESATDCAAQRVTTEEAINLAVRRRVVHRRTFNEVMERREALRSEPRHASSVRPHPSRT